jgi:hypothetical protein
VHLEIVVQRVFLEAVAAQKVHLEAVADQTVVQDPEVAVKDPEVKVEDPEVAAKDLEVAVVDHEAEVFQRIVQKVVAVRKVDQKNQEVVVDQAIVVAVEAILHHRARSVQF